VVDSYRSRAVKVPAHRDTGRLRGPVVCRKGSRKAASRGYSGGDA
jgi:hypothetical protein